jgi:hypothetical protein
MRQPKHPRRKAKSVGRPRTTGTGTQINIRCHAGFLERVDKWQNDNAPELTRPQAIKQLAEIGLKSSEG